MCAASDVVFLGMSLDDPSVTPSEDCRYDLGIAFPFARSGDGLLAGILQSRGRSATQVRPPDGAECGPRGFSMRDFEPQEIAAMHCIGDIGNIERAWHYLYRLWLPSTPFDPADSPAMEVFVRIPEEIGWETFDLPACIPVVPL